MKASRSQAAALLSAATLTSLLLLGCSAHAPGGGLARRSPVHDPQDAPPTDLELARLRHAERLEVGGDERRRAVELERSVEASWDRGQARWLESDVEGAHAAFDEAVEAVLAADVDLAAHPELSDRLETLIGDIHGLVVEGALDVQPAEELEVAAAGAATPPATWAPAATDPAGRPDWLRKVTGDFTLPVHDAPSVDSMIRFYTGKGKERFEIGLRRAGKYGPTVVRILEEEGVPLDLFWLALVESNFNAQAYSRARAKGLWQFIPGTGRRYGLGIDYWADERADFEKATRSSARYLKDLHAMFGDWHLALAAYNAGEGKVGRAIRRTGHRDYWHIRRTRHLRSETKTYVPAMMAVLQIVRDPARYGVRFEPDPPLAWEPATVTACTDLGVIAECAGTSKDLVLELNPELRRGCTPGSDSPYRLRLPVGTRERFETRLAALPPEKRLNWRRHVVRSGDTLSAIARVHGSTVGAIMAANGLRNGNRIGVGWNLLVPSGPTASAVPAAVLASAVPPGARSTPASATSSQRDTRVYRVRPGDTLGKIAKAHGTSATRLARLNDLANANRIRPGQRILIEGSSSGSRSTRPTVHVVRRGDTLTRIASSHGTSVANLRAWNGIARSGLIHPGQRIVVRQDGRKKTTYSVRRGDTLTRIAQAHSTTVEKLRRWNGLRRNGYIHPGDRLTIFVD